MSSPAFTESPRSADAAPPAVRLWPSLEPAQNARAVLPILETVKTEMAVAMNPNRQALQALGLNAPLGGTKLCYHDTAFSLWSELRARDGDLDATHHLAIMHHARAIDLEAGADPARSDADWEKALAFWLELWRADAFWAGLGKRAGSEPAAAKLREQLPALLLQMHYDIAFCIGRQDGNTPLHRSKYHLQLVKKSDFPKEAKAQVQEEAFKAFTAALPATYHTERDEAALQPVLKRLEQFLQIDPECRVALEDALGVLVRLLLACVQELNAGGQEAANRPALLQKMAQQEKTWRPYIDQFAAMGGLDPNTRDRLGCWYRLQAIAQSELERFDRAQDFYAAGIRVTEPGDEERQRCEDGRVVNMARAARDAAEQRKPDAKAKCDLASAEPGLTITAIFLLAIAYQRLDRLDLADQMCRRGLALEATEDNAEMQESLRQFQEKIAQMRNRGRR